LSLPNILFLWPVPVVTAAAALLIWRGIARGPEPLPFLASIFLFLLGLSGLGVSIFPYAVPWRITLWQAAASTPTLEFTGVGVLLILPIILAYLAYAHWIFRGKATAESGYGGH
jgi:cytochrome bd ubiquinol oxidase subunit II